MPFLDSNTQNRRDACSRLLNLVIRTSAITLDFCGS
jgi:hypothetical protein